MIEACRRLWPNGPVTSAFGVYLSLRHLELLRARAEAYEQFLCQLAVRELNSRLAGHGATVEMAAPTVASLQQALSQLSIQLGKRIVLFFDDAAHIGREASLAEFFEIFRTVSSSTVSCKAAIYPGVTRFGTRFDVYNDATVLEVTRSEELPGFREVLSEIIVARYQADLPESAFTGSLSREDVASFIGQSVLGNMRAFVFACSELVQRRGADAVGLNHLTDTLLSLSSNHYWPLLEELKPKLGAYEPMVDPARQLADSLFDKCGMSDARPLALVHRDITEKLAKPFEILEYVGFIAKREASRAMKSGGRGARFALNLCNLLEKTPGTRLTRDLFRRWRQDRSDPVEFHRGSELVAIQLPALSDDDNLEILSEPVDILAKSPAYPYGLTEAKIAILKEAGIRSVGGLASATDEQLLNLPYVGPASLQRFRNVVGQAIWM